MKCIFINLDAASDRRAAVERNFLTFVPSDWHLERFRAVDVAGVTDRKVCGALSPKEIACALSHMDVIRQQQGTAEPCLILEDDVLFGPHSCGTMRDSIAFLEAQGEWDILFPDLCIAQIGMMADLLALRRILMAQGRSRLLDPRGLAFSSATSYILHPRAVTKILGAEPTQWNVPYDLFLRQLVQEGRLRARYIFPFALSLEETSNVSTIQPGSYARTGYIWYLFRRMIWRDGNFEDHLSEIEDLMQTLSAETLAHAHLWAAMADPSFRPK